MVERDFLVPDLGEGLEEATLMGWLVATGGPVELNQPLCVLETAKAEVEIPSPHAGRLLECRGEAGDTLAVGTMLARIETDSCGEVSPDTASAHAASDREPVLVGYGVDDTADRSRRASRNKSTVDVSPTKSQTGTKPLAKPPVRKLAHDLGVELTSLHPGSGPGGAITRADVTGAARGPATAPPPPNSGDEVIAVRGIRARIAERMTTAHQHIPDAHCSVTVDCGRLLEVRARLRDTAGDSAHAITPFVVILRLLLTALREHPLVNSTYDEDGPAIRTFSAIHLGIGTATERGLLVPVVRNADQLDTLRLAEEVSRLALAAREGTAQPTELTGSTFTVSNFGALGLDEGVPIINHPEAAILGLGAIKARPTVRDGEIVASPTSTITCAFDHRVSDGAQAGAFLSRIQELIETPELALLKS